MHIFNTEEITLEQQVQRAVRFFSHISGLPIIHTRYTPENLNEFDKNSVIEGVNIAPVQFQLRLADDQESYEVEWHMHYNPFKNDRLESSESVIVNYNDKQIYTGGSTGFGGPTMPDFNTIFEPGVLEKNRLTNLLGIFGGKMDDVKNSDFEQDKGKFPFNLYHFIISHKKELGQDTPPIQLNNPAIYEAMMKGDTKDVDRLLNRSSMHAVGRLETTCIAHMDYEKRMIRAKTLAQKDFIDPSISLEDKFPDMKRYKIEGEGTFPTYNIVILEDYQCKGRGSLAEQIRDVLAYDGRHGNTTIYSDDNLDICGTGQVDLVLWMLPDEYSEINGDDLKHETDIIQTGEKSYVFCIEGKSKAQATKTFVQFFVEAEMKDWEKSGVDVPDIFYVSEGHVNNLAGIINRRLGQEYLRPVAV